MTAMDWNDLENAWRSLPAEAAPAIDELKRQQQRRWLSTFILSSEILTGVAGLVVGVAVLVQGLYPQPDITSIMTGVGTIIFVAAVSASSWWARSLAPVRAEDPVMFALDAAVRRAQIGVRLAIATLWSLAGALVFLALILIVVQMEERPAGYTTFAFTLIWMAVWLAGTVFYLVRRMADLARLQALRASFGG